MNEAIRRHYSAEPMLADAILSRLVAAGKDPSRLTIDDLAPIDEFHVRGRKATLELADRMELDPQARVLDLGSGLGGSARTLARVFGCRVVGIDLAPALCEAAATMSDWVGLAGKVTFEQADATALDFEPRSFDAVMTIHAAMNIAAKDAMYAGAHRALKPGGIFAVYDILQGEGGDVLYPVPWARDASISQLATAALMRDLLRDAGFSILDEIDSSDESLEWFERATQAATRAAPLTFRAFLGPDHVQMARNQVRNLAERRIRTISYICRK